MTADYCTVQQVATQLGLVDTATNKVTTPPSRLTISPTTNPTITTVTEMIEDAQDFIDEECDTSWRSKTVTRERHSIYKQIRHSRWYYTIQLNNKYCKALDEGQSDELRVFNGSTMEEWLGVKTEGVAPGDQDYYFDATVGRLFINTSYPDRRENNVDVTYRYGKTSVPNSIRRATILIASAYIIQSGILDYYFNVAEGGDQGMKHQQKAEKWIESAEKLTDAFKTPLFFPQA